MRKKITLQNFFLALWVSLVGIGDFVGPLDKGFD